jgi:ribosome-binding factor A
VGKQIEREIGSFLLTDELMLDVTKNRRANVSLCSCSGVEISNDLQVVKIYISMLTNDPQARETVMIRLKGLSGCA